MNKIRIKSFQEKLEKENNKKIFYSLDFKGELWLIVTKDEIYVRNWNPTCPSIPDFKFWSEEKENEFDDCIYMHFEEYDDAELDDIISLMIKECKYTERKFGE